jgi:hypothetical protein
MPSAAATASQGTAPNSQQSTPMVPFTVGSNQYEEPPFVTTTQLLDGNSHETVVNITPGGFLRGCILQVTSTGGVIGAGVLANDAPWTILSSVSIEDISGGPILYPLSGFAAYCVQKYLRPWDGDPSKRAVFSNTVNPAFTLRLMVEVRETLAVVANTDARAQYRLRFTIAPSGNTFTTAPTTLPTVTVKGSFLTWAQPDLQDLLGNAIEPTPEGMIASRFVMHELPQLNAGNNVIRHTLVGNEIRGVVWIIRNSVLNGALGTRVDLTDANAGALDFRLDNRRLWKRNPTQLVEEMTVYYEQLANATWTRDTGVYAVSRYRDPGRVLGEYWLQTVEQTLLQLEINGSDLGANVPGSFEIIYDELAIAGNLPAHLEGL